MIVIEHGSDYGNDYFGAGCPEPRELAAITSLIREDFPGRLNSNRNGIYDDGSLILNYTGIKTIRR